MTLEYGDDPELFIAAQGLARMHQNEINENDAVPTIGEENHNNMQKTTVRLKIL